jgi:hypothetical protein
MTQRERFIFFLKKNLPIIYFDLILFCRLLNDACIIQSIFLIRLVGGGVQLGPLGTAATDWPIVACPG